MVRKNRCRRPSNRKPRAVSPKQKFASFWRPTKQPSVPNDDREDRISSLPDDLLLSIVSSLPLREWSALSTVSRRWRCLVRLLPRCDSFRYESAWPYDPPLLPRAFIRRFHLVNCLGEDLIGHAGDAADAAAEELVVEASSTKFPSFEVPSSVFRIKTLRLLSMRNYDLIGGSHCGFDCPLLTTLKIELGFISRGAIMSILDRCPRLETLHLVDVCCGGTGFIEFHSESLKKLWFRPYMVVLTTISIRAPNLEVLILDLDRILFDELRVQVPKVQEMCLYISFSIMKCTSRVLSVTEITSFTLNAGAAKWLESECVDFDRFEKMNTLKISVDIGGQPRARTFLVKLLENCPRLSRLDLQVSGCPLLEGRRKENSQRKRNFAALRERLKKLECLHHHIKDVSLDFRVITKFEVDLLRVIFTEATALQRLQLILPGRRVSRGIRAILSSKAPRNKEEPYTCSSRRTIKMEF